jgi:hypothetical protein
MKKLGMLVLALAMCFSGSVMADPPDTGTAGPCDLPPWQRPASCPETVDDPEYRECVDGCWIACMQLGGYMIPCVDYCTLDCF